MLPFSVAVSVIQTLEGLWQEDGHVMVRFRKTGKDLKTGTDLFCAYCFFDVISPFRKISIKQELSNNHDEKDIRFNPKTK